uniref:Uncharacterized protein n=1 Tax=Sinocyclocheilus anshuiensis TaxID=1608454 RepID=A0A671K5P4_9TELE
MFRLFSLAAAERGGQKRRLELSLAGICELELLKRRHEALVAGALALHSPEPEPKKAERPSEDPTPPVRLVTVSGLRILWKCNRLQIFILKNNVIY